MLRTRSPRKEKISNCYLHSNSLSNKMDNSLLAVRDINHKYIVVEREVHEAMKDLQVKYTDPLDLIPYENNPRINDYAVKKVMESIKEYGFTNPIIVDADMVIIAGHTRREASILAGLDRVPYIVRDDLTPEQVKAYRIADNKLAELSNWDDELLKKELFELQAVDYSLEVMGFTEIDLKEIFTEKEVPKEKKKKEEKTTLPMLRFGSNSVRITEDELVMLSNRYNEYVESTPDEGFITWLLKRGL